MIAAETFFELLRDPAHWMFEAASDLAFGVLVYFPARRAWNRWHARHDRREHL